MPVLEDCDPVVAAAGEEVVVEVVEVAGVVVPVVDMPGKPVVVVFAGAQTSVLKPTVLHEVEVKFMVS